MKRVVRDRGLVPLLWAGALICWALSGCATQRRVVVGLSPDMEARYAVYPSIEFDAVAVTAEEAEQIKKDGVDGYFAPDSPLRKRLEPFTVYFSQERTQPATLHVQSERWDRWLKKKPVTLALLADLPPSPDMPGEDPRIIYIDLKKNAVFARPVYVEIEPGKLARVFDLPRDPRTGKEAEIRRPNAWEAGGRSHENPSAPTDGQDQGGASPGGETPGGETPGGASPGDEETTT